jgi:hypothetical protein
MTEWKCVPTEPTLEMCLAWSVSHLGIDLQNGKLWTDDLCAARDWKAMIAAAPSRQTPNAQAIAHLIVENLNEDMTNALEVGRKIAAMVTP